jgi:hypothetical protein
VGSSFRRRVRMMREYLSFFYVRIGWADTMSTDRMDRQHSMINMVVQMTFFKYETASMRCYVRGDIFIAMKNFLDQS